MTAARVGQTATLLPSGQVLIVGGEGDAGPLASTELYDPKTGQFSRTASMTTAREDHTATLLSDGRVLVAGGVDAGGVSSPLASAELYDPKTGEFSAAGSMTTGRDSPSATLLPDGRVLIVGGANGYTAGPHRKVVALSSAELFQP
jgi:hypothetical protein